MEHRGEGGIADNTAQDGDRIEANLHHGEKHPRVFLHFQHTLSINIAIIGEKFEFNFTGCGQGNF